MDKTSLIELSYRRSRASCVGLDVVTKKSPADRCTSDRKIRPLASYNQNSIVVMVSAVPVTVGVTVKTWLCGFLLPRE
ncbi:unnamed protein product, partial [Brassica rapa subsp. narinosa]